jgi:tripartite-type tricarboxylate transporter receptor subunit TctC
MQDLMGGQIPAIFASLSAAAPQMRSGKIKVLGLVEAKRQPSAPDIPTMGESIPGYALLRNTLGFYGPAGLPAPITARLHAEFMKALYAPDVRAKIEAAGMPLIGSSSEEFANQVKQKIELYRKITSDAGIKPE